MKYKTFMTIHSIALAYFAAGSLFTLILFWQTIYRVDIGGESVWLVRVLGVLVFANLSMSWASLNMDNNPGRLAILTTFSGAWLIYGLISLWGQLVGVYSLLNWSNVVVALLFSFGLYQFHNKNMNE